MDLTIVRWAAEHLHGPFLDTVMPYITALGDSGFIWVVICFVLLARKRPAARASSAGCRC